MKINDMSTVAKYASRRVQREKGAGKALAYFTPLVELLAEVHKAEMKYIREWEKLCGPLDAELPTFPAKVLDFFPNAMRPAMEELYLSENHYFLAAHTCQLGLYCRDEKKSAILEMVDAWSAKLTPGQQAQLVSGFSDVLAKVQDALKTARTCSPEAVEAVAIAINTASAWRRFLTRLKCDHDLDVSTEAAWDTAQGDAQRIWEGSDYRVPFRSPILTTLAAHGAGWWTTAPNTEAPELHPDSWAFVHLD